MALGPLAGKLGDVEDSSANASLPRGAESTRVNTELEKFRTDTVMPVVVYTGAGDRAKAAAADTAEFQRLAARGERVSPPVPSDDGEALLTVVPLDSEDEITDRIDELRDIADAGVAVLLLITYRSPILRLFPLLSVTFAAVLTQVGTDYALPLIARYREELHLRADRHEAMRIALRRSGPAILASAGTITIGPACLAFADINSPRSLGLVGLVGAVGVVCAFAAMVTALPAPLVIAGRWVFWPFVPRHGTPARKEHTVWSRIGAASRSLGHERQVTSGDHAREPSPVSPS